MESVGKRVALKIEREIFHVFPMFPSFIVIYGNSLASIVPFVTEGDLTPKIDDHLVGEFEGTEK
jgi:hypothetical protein